MLISFPSQGQFDLARAILAQAYESGDGGEAETHSVRVTNPDLAALLQRVAEGAVTVLPLLGVPCDHWLLVADSRHAAERALTHASRFVLPSFGSLPGNTHFARYRSLDEADSPLRVAIEAGYAGYFEWRTPPGQRVTVLRRLGLWARLEAGSPPLTLERSPRYADLFAEFQSALAAANWAAAEHALANIRRLHLCAFDNLQFLRFELLAHRGEWRTIWSDPAFPVLAAGPTPRAVRAAMIAAFHQSVLLPAEQSGDFDAALTKLRDAQPRLGTLLTGRFDLTDSAVVRVFAYQAAAAHDRDSLDELLANAPLDDSARTVLTALRDRLPRPTQPLLPPADRLRRALHLRDYDTAVQAAGELDDPVERTFALLRIALHHPDAISGALAAYDGLTAEQRRLLEDEEPFADTYLERVLGLAPRAQAAIRTWPDWFERLVADPNDASLNDAVDTLRQSLDDRSWPQEILQATRLKLETILVENEPLLAGREVQRAIAAIADQLLGDEQFPRTDVAYADLYDTLLDCLVLRHEVNDNEGRKLLRLMDARLRRQPSKVETVAHDLRGWFSHPSLALEPLLLDGFDLLINYGAQRHTIFDLYRQWLDQLLDLPTAVAWERASQEVWLSIGEWLQPGDDLLRQLRQRLATVVAASVQDPLTKLPPGYQIAVFTLNPSAARRAGEIIQQRNAQVHMQIRSDTVLTDAAATLASRADVVVIVSTCLTHAVFYGIKPYLQRDPVYPSFQGAASIVHALEEFAERL